MRYLVTRPDGDLNEVVGDEFVIHDNGALVFTEHDGHYMSTTTVVYAPGQWLTIVPGPT